MNAAAPAGAVLEVSGVDAGYRDFQALFELSLEVGPGQVVAVIGANGAGKSTLLKTIVGLVLPRSGRIRVAGVDITSLPAHRRVRHGVALVPEGRRLFGSLSVQENLQVGGHRARPGPWDLAAVYELFPLVQERRDRGADSLSGGEQQAVAIGRALMANPRLLLLDEVSLGLAPVIVRQLYAALPQIVGAGTAVLLVEQDVEQALAVADTVHCLLEGRTVLSAPAATVDRADIADAYFGTAHR